MSNKLKLEKDICDCCGKETRGSMIYYGGVPLEFRCHSCAPMLYKRTYREHFEELAETAETTFPIRKTHNRLTLGLDSGRMVPQG